jgi:uncharacterized membrane protein
VNFLENLGDVIWFFLISFIFIAYLMALFSIITDLFRDQELSGVGKAVWLIALLFLPLLTALVYLIVRGEGMAKRGMKEARENQAATDEYIRSVAKASPSEEIAKAKALLDAGTITADEYTAIKAKALG